MKFRRGLNPPHRVKSINMATFTQEEIDFLKTRGNHVRNHTTLSTNELNTIFTFK